MYYLGNFKDTFTGYYFGNLKDKFTGRITSWEIKKQTILSQIKQKLSQKLSQMIIELYSSKEFQIELSQEIKTKIMLEFFNQKDNIINELEQKYVFRFIEFKTKDTNLSGKKEQFVNTSKTQDESQKVERKIFKLIDTILGLLYFVMELVSLGCRKLFLFSSDPQTRGS